MPDLGFEQFLAAISAVGALGIAAFGVTEAFLKAWSFWSMSSGRGWGLCYMGFGRIKQLTEPLDRSLKFAYGPDYLTLLAQQYRDGRRNGRAPETIRQGVRLGLPYLSHADAVALLTKFWATDVYDKRASQLAHTLCDRGAGSEGVDHETQLRRAEAEDNDAVALAGRFSLALDARVEAAFSIAEERYKAFVQLSAAVVAITLSLLFNLSFWLRDPSNSYPWLVAFLIGAAAVPLAPVTKDLTSALRDALKAWRAVGGASG